MVFKQLKGCIKELFSSLLSNVDRKLAFELKLSLTFKNSTDETVSEIIQCSEQNEAALSLPNRRTGIK